MKLLTHANGYGAPELMWREQTQQTILADLGRAPKLKPGASPNEWRAARAAWRELIRKHSHEAVKWRGQPIAAEIASETLHDGYRLQNIVLEVMPGFKIVLHLYLPTEEAGPYVPILCPCGHGPKWQADHQRVPQILARSGFAAALFDMPGCGHRIEGNDHGPQGAQAQMLGVWSNVFFMVDGIRIADYLETRDDITFAHGMGSTGVSGGGLTTLFLAHIDERVRCIAPVCCTASLSGHIVGGLYTGCPENYLPGQARLGLDYDDLPAITAPMPCLLMNGAKDYIFRIQDVLLTAEKSRAAYSLENADEKFLHFEDDVPHEYSAAMAKVAARWFRRWLLNDETGAFAGEEILLPESSFDVAIKQGTMAGWNAQHSEELHLKRRSGFERAAEALPSPADIGLRVPGSATAFEVPREEWQPAELSAYIVSGEGDLPLPALQLSRDAGAGGTVLACGDEGKFKLLREMFGMPARTGHDFLFADLRGWGELVPDSPPFDIYPWCKVDSSICDLLFLCGETALGQQVSDVLRIVDAMTGEREVTLYGRGAAALPILFAGLLHPRVKRIALQEYLVSLGALASETNPTWSRYAYLPNALLHFDLPELIAAQTDKRFLLMDPRDGRREPMSEAAISEVYGGKLGHVTVHGGDRVNIGVKLLGSWLKDLPITSV